MEVSSTNRWQLVAGGLMCPECSQIWSIADNETDRFKACPECGAVNSDGLACWPKMDLVILPFSSKKHCGLKKFTINGIKASENDFGEGFDECPDAAAKFGCGYRRFKRNGRPNRGILEKYHITLSDYKLICDRLESVLTVGRCNYCA